MSFQLLLVRLDKLAQVLRAPRLVRALVYGRVLAGAEHRHILEPHFTTVVDIGANLGQFALAAREYAPRVRVIAFEPLPGPGAIFRRVFAGDSMVCLHPVAIGAKAREAVIHVTEADDSSSLLPVSPFRERNNHFCL